MTTENPTGYVLSGPRRKTADGEYVVMYRPNIAGRRKRVSVPADVADLLEEAQADEVEHRHNLVSKRKASKRKASKRKASKRKASKRKASKRASKQSAPASAPMSDQGPGQTEFAFGNPAKGAPNLGRLGTVAHLGRVSKMIVLSEDGRYLQHHWKKNLPLLLWSPNQRCLVWVIGRGLVKKKAGAVRTDGAAHTFERFAQRDARHTSKIKIPSAKLYHIGAAVQIWYRSDKWDEKKTYYHDFSAKVRVFQGGKVWAVRGGALTVTERGLVY